MPNKVFLPAEKVMKSMLLDFDKDPGFKDKVYPELLKSAGKELTAEEMAGIIRKSIEEYLKETIDLATYISGWLKQTAEGLVDLFVDEEDEMLRKEIKDKLKIHTLI